MLNLGLTSRKSKQKVGGGLKSNILHISYVSVLLLNILVQKIARGRIITFCKKMLGNRNRIAKVQRSSNFSYGNIFTNILKKNIVTLVAYSFIYLY